MAQSQIKHLIAQLRQMGLNEKEIGAIIRANK